MAEPSASESSPETDRDFDPTAEMLVNDFDDERTLEEEEALESGEEAKHELDDLHKEGDMPIEELLAMYGYGDNNQADNTQSSSSEEILSNQDLTLDKDEIARDLLKDEDTKKETTIHDLLSSVDASVSTSRLLRSAVSHHHSESDTETEDEDYVPDDDDDWKKTIQVGSDFQAVIPEGLSKYDDAPAYENDDKSLWDPSKLTDQEVEDYLQAAEQPQANRAQGVDAVPTGCHVRDDEQALYLLLQCGHSIEEALRRRRMQTVLPTDTMSLWSEEECRSFENGLRTYGKDFHLIQQHKVRTRSVGELVQFYYLWKKTERHDVFANKARLEKKKYTLHPGTTDYMDRFLDEQENPPQQRDRSLSPNVNSLISGDYKRQHHNRTPPMTSYLSPPENHHHHHHHHHHYHHPQPPTLAHTSIPTSPVLNATMAIESSPTPPSEVSLPLAAGVQGFVPLSFGNLASSGNHVSPPTVFTNVALTCPTRPKVSADLSQDSRVGTEEHLKAVTSMDSDCLDPMGRLGTGSGELAQAETSNGVGVASATCGSEHKAHKNFDIVSPRATALNSMVVNSSASE